VGEPDEVIQNIAEHVARLVPDGGTLQLGIGRMPDAVLSLLQDKNDLGIHTEMFSDGVMRLAKAGVITGRRKTLHRGKIVGSFAAGSTELFRFLDDNPQIEMHPSEYTNNPFVISRHDNMIAVNAALEIDLTGQVVADSLGTWYHSGIGGHAASICRRAAVDRLSVRRRRSRRRSPGRRPKFLACSLCWRRRTSARRVKTPLP